MTGSQYDNNRCTSRASTIIKTDSASFLISISESRACPSEIGIAAMNIETYEFILSQFADNTMHTRVMHFINIFVPKNILLCTCESENTPLIQSLTSTFGFSSRDILMLSRKYYNEACGLQFVTDYSLVEHRVKMLQDLKGKYYMLAALGSLIFHIQASLGMVFVKNTIKFTLYSLNSIMMIDYSTAKSLELVSNLIDRKSQMHLLGKINFTYTPMGYRLLRQQILQPSTDLGTLKMRQDCVNELLLNQGLLNNISTVLKTICDVEKLISSFLDGSKTVHKAPDFKLVNVLAIKNILKQSSSLQAIFQGLKNPLFEVMSENFSQPESELLQENIRLIVNEDCIFARNSSTMKDSKFYCVNYGINGLLDAARTVCNTCESEITDYIKMISEINSIAIKPKYTKGKGYLLSFRISEIADREIPDIFINGKRQNGFYLCTTIDLLKLNDRHQECLTEIFLLSDQILDQIAKIISENAKYFYILSETISLLDFVVSLANYASTLPFCCFPDFTDTVAIQESHHPIFEKYVANNYYCYEGGNFEIISGPNMSGKSTYMKQLAYLAVLAQIGSCIPARYASLKMFDKIMARINNDDDLESNSSSFYVEMKEMSSILQNYSPKSLILVDELGRGTSIQDGFGLAFAICEELIRKNAFVFFVTHFLQLCDELDVYPNVVNLHFESSINLENEVVQNFTVQKGVASNTDYGIQLAVAKKIPKTIIDFAREVSTHIALQKSQRGIHSFKNIAIKERNLKIRFASKVQNLVSQCLSTKETLLSVLEQNYRQLEQELQELNE